MTTQSIAGWLRDFLDRRGLDKPDGRPLFKYGVTPAEFEVLRSYFEGYFPTNSHEKVAFCLYVAEWWRRHGRGFKWEGLRESLDLKVPYTDFYGPLEHGLSYWKRELRIARATTGGEQRWRDFVGTMSREGGLPMQLLLSEQNSLRRFFRALLKERYASGSMSPEKAEVLGGLLPAAWRHPDIFELAAELVTRVWELRDLVGNAERPVAELDRVHPEWKATLPVLVDSDVASALVRGLVEEAHELAAAGRPPLKVETFASTDGKTWHLERLVEPPRKINPDRVRSMLGAAEQTYLPSRLRLRLDVGDEPQPLAVATQWSPETAYIIEPLVETPVALRGTGEVRLVGELENEALGSELLPGGDALEDVPWIFTADGEEGGRQTWKLVTQGSGGTRASAALVALPERFSMEPDGDADTSDAGFLDRPDGSRRLVVIHGGAVAFTDSEGDGARYRVRVNTPEDELWSYRLSGSLFPVQGSVPVWLGVPGVIAETPSGARRSLATRDLEWRPRNIGSSWSAMSEDCVGDVEIRYVREGTTHFRRAAKILPPKTEVVLVPREDPSEGGLCLCGLGADVAEILAGEGFSVEAMDRSSGFEWTFRTSEPASAPAAIDVELIWRPSRRMRLRLPYPVAGVRFVDRAGRVLPAEATVGFDNLAGCRVEAIVPSTERVPRIVAKLNKAGKLTSGFVRDSAFYRPLRATRLRDKDGLQRYVLNLSELAEDLRLRLASSTEMNAFVKLSVESPGAGKATLSVRRAPVALWVDKEAGQVKVLADKSETGLEEKLKGMVMRRVPVKKPDAAWGVLERSGDEAWDLGEPEPHVDTWLIAGFDGERCCSRPVVWASRPVASEEDEDSGPCEEPAAPQEPVQTLAEAVEIPKTELRNQALEDLLARMVRDPKHPEWKYVMPYVETLTQLPATTFDLLDAMARTPATCVYALFAGQSKLSFHALWTRLEDLPFAWTLVPLTDWVRGVRVWWEQSCAGLEQLEDSVSKIVRESILSDYKRTADHIMLRMPAFAFVREMIEEAVLPDVEQSGQSLKNMVSMVGASGEAGRRFFLQLRDEALMDLRRAHADDEWPMFDATRALRNHLDTVLPRQVMALERFSSTVNGFQVPVVVAPVLAALSVAWGVSLHPEQIFAIRQLRAFDVNWFQTCFQTSLAVAVGRILDHDPERYR